MTKKEVYIKVTENGPYLVFGEPKISEKTIITDENKVSIQYAEGEIYSVGEHVALCRCGSSRNAPFCDRSHRQVGFDGKETATFDLILNDAEVITGPNYTLMDNDSYCAFARFCDANGQIWNLVNVGKEDTDAIAVQESFNCPSGRLMMIDPDGKQLEPELALAISPLEDKSMGISGPLWVQGGIRVESASGKSYEVRNRQTLCRCGASKNKPFCNGSHAAVKYKAK